MRIFGGAAHGLVPVAMESGATRYVAEMIRFLCGFITS
jgi:hypothetical protein